MEIEKKSPSEDIKKIVKHEWTQLATVLITIMGLFLWTQSESRADRRELKQSIDALRENTYLQLNAIQEEIKDFHGRLCMIEERNKK